MIGIVGGGIAGLAAARRLRAAGREVRVFEAGEYPGGLAATYPTAGDRIERFYHHLSKSEEAIVELARELGLGDRVEWRVGKNAYYVDGVVHPLDTPWEILAYPHMSLSDKFRLAMLTLGVDVRGGRPRLDAYEDLTAYEDVPIREFLLEHTTRGVYEQFFEPLLDAKFGDRKEEVSAAWLLGRIRFRGERDPLRGEVLGYFEGGFGVLLDALVEAVGRDNIETGARVTDLGFAGRDGAPTEADGGTPGTRGEADPTTGDAGAAGGGAGAAAGEGERAADAPGTGRSVESLTVETDAGPATHAVDAVVVATMPGVLEALTGYACDVDFQGAVCGVLTLREALTDTYWLNIAHDAPFGALIEHTNFVPPERYGGQHLLYLASYVQDLEGELCSRSDAEIESLWLDHLGEMFPAFDRDAVEQFRLSRAPRAAPVYERGYLEKVVPYDLSGAVADGVYYAGMASRAQYPERSLNGGVVAGRECADRILGRVGD